MIGWKIICDIDSKETACEIVGNPMFNDHLGAVVIPVYHDGKIKIVDGERTYTEFKVIERKN